MDEQRKYEVIKKLVERKGNKNAAALKVGITPRYVNRLIKAYKEKGKDWEKSVFLEKWKYLNWA